MDFKNLSLSEKNLKKLLVVPIALLVISIAFMGVSYAKHGSILQKGIDLEGGVQITVHYSDPVDSSALEARLQDSLGTADASVVTTTNPATRLQETVIISVGGDYKESDLVPEIESALNTKLEPTKYSVRAVGPALAGSFWKQAVWAFTFAFIFMACVVAWNYKKFVPTIAIIISTTYDLSIIIGFMALLEFHLSLSTIAALLMIIGYSVDTNVLLTNKIFRERDGELFDRINSGLKTGLTMSASTISVLLALFFVGGAYSLVLRDISGILLIGLLADIPNTWMLNANILTWHQK